MFQIKYYLSKIIIKVTENLKKLLQSMYKAWLMNIYSLFIIFRIRKKISPYIEFYQSSGSGTFWCVSMFYLNIVIHIGVLLCLLDYIVSEPESVTSLLFGDKLSPKTLQRSVVHFKFNTCFHKNLMWSI